MQKYRIETDLMKVRHFLELNDYPETKWHDPGYLEQSMVVRVLNEANQTLAYCWGHWIEEATLTVHLCVDEGVRLDWTDLVSSLLGIAYFLGADEVALKLDDDPRLAAFSRLLRRHGFHQTSSSTFNSNHFYRIRTDGFSDPRSREAGGSSDQLEG